MPPSERRLHRGRREADETLRRLSSELRIARRSAGLSQRVLARAAGISPAQVSRLERGEVRGASVRVYSVLSAILGLKLTCRAYPNGSPLRDAAHLRLIRRFAAQLPPGVSLRTEVPVGLPGDLRAWDGELDLGKETCKLEAETVIADAQALERRLGRKMLDDGVDVVILLVADTRRNRAALDDAGLVLAARFPLSMRRVMAAVRAGRCPARSGIVIL
jgi:transcriptional regulator with XRE-family HTH domain